MPSRRFDRLDQLKAREHNGDIEAERPTSMYVRSECATMLAVTLLNRRYGIRIERLTGAASRALAIGFRHRLLLRVSVSPLFDSSAVPLLHRDGPSLSPAPLSVAGV
jgi:hypothetical protein